MSNLISRQAAIDAMKQSVCGDTWEVDKAIEAVERVPSAQPEPIKVSVDHEMTEEELKELKKKIADSPVILLPSAQPEPHEGHWINAKLECGKSDHQHITTARTAAQRWMKKRRTLMTNYSDIEIQTAKNLLKEGYTWIARDESGGLFAYIDKPSKLDTFWCSDGYISQVCKEFVPIFQNVRFGDKEPISLESIVPPILDDAEKRYLSAVIRPFRDRVKYIEKIDCACEEYIYIQVNRDWTILPRFKDGTMYKGMEPGHKYTLEELGL